MQVRFWGTRGSIAKPGPLTARYGGNTSCIEVRSSRGTLVIVDCGTGAHPLGQKLLAGGGPLRGHILISHTHWDHIQGIPFFAPLFIPGNQWDIYGPRGMNQSLREALAGQMQYTYFPVTPDQFGAAVRYHDLVEGVFEVDDVRVTTHYLNHPALALGYRIEADGASVVYCCDHEPHSRNLAVGEGEIAGQDRRHADFFRGADLLIHDAQYKAAEYPSKIGWGHSTNEYAVRLAQHAQVKTLALTHHDPMRSDDAIDSIVADINASLERTASPLRVFAAVEGETVSVEPSPIKTAAPAAERFDAKAAPEMALGEQAVLMCVSDSRTGDLIAEAVRTDGIRVEFFSEPAEVPGLLAKYRPSLAILEHDAGRMDGFAAAAAIRRMDRELPVVLIAAKEDQAAGESAGVSDWLIRPFTAAYARTRVRAWVLRTACRWMLPPVPGDEQQRLSSLRELQILDTPREERFDRVTRLAAALFDVPMALISLIDEDRQWFKSSVGLGPVTETPRDMSFCAHAVFHREPLIVPDTLLDDRFADNPAVMNEPRVRFYAGYPLFLDNGSCIGTLCLVDTRPRELDQPGLDRLKDLAGIACREIAAVAAVGPHASSAGL
jgi:phosphoribosyl 1,2-cyclic phosphodiesterase/DNA-binding response OmpR family regulator